jgi:serine/threonine protein kinase
LPPAKLADIIMPPIQQEQILRKVVDLPPEPIDLPVTLDDTIIRDFPALTDLSRIGEGDRFITRAYVSHGGMGAVISGYDRDPEDLDYARVAIKMTSRSYAKLLQTEALVLQMIDSPHVPKYIETGIDKSGMVFVAQEFIEGPSALDLLETYGVLTPEEAFGIIRNVCSALKTAYELKTKKGENLHIMHKDIKPSNILIREETGEAVLIDWGLSTRKTKGAQVGTPLYMSPEQMHSREVDFRSDIYSLGIVLYMLLYGNNPFLPDYLLAPIDPDPEKDAAIKFSIIKGLKAGDLPPFGVITNNSKAQKMIVNILNKMLAVMPENRHQSYDKLISEIDQILKELNTVRPSNSSLGDAILSVINDDLPTFVEPEVPSISESLSSEKS